MEYIFEQDLIKIDKDHNLIIPLDQIDWKQISNISIYETEVGINYRNEFPFIIHRNKNGTLSYNKTIHETIG